MCSLFQFCAFIAVPWLRHSAGKVACVFIDYMDYVPLSTRIQFFIETQEEWTEVPLGKYLTSS